MIHKNAERYGYRIISSELEYENPFTNVYKYEVKLPDGTTKPYWNIEQSPFPIIVPLFHDKSTILVGQYRVTTDNYSWEFPMGTLQGNDILATAKAELHEETGFTAKNWHQIGTMLTMSGRSNMQGVVLVAEELAEGIAQPDQTEFLETKRLAIDEVGKMIESSIIVDSATISAFHFLEKYLMKL